MLDELLFWTSCQKKACLLIKPLKHRYNHANRQGDTRDTRIYYRRGHSRNESRMRFFIVLSELPDRPKCIWSRYETSNRKYTRKIEKNSQHDHRIQRNYQRRKNSIRTFLAE